MCGYVCITLYKEYLNDTLIKIDKFLKEKLKLKLHENKCYIKTYASGVDFLGRIHFPHYRQIRTMTKRRILSKLKGYPKQKTINSYRGLLSHGNTHKIKKLAGI